MTTTTKHAPGPWVVERGDGGPAFPNRTKSTFYKNDVAQSSIVEEHEPGMSLRDWFAGQVLQAMVPYANSASGTTPDNVCAKTAALAYLLADAMLAERQQRHEAATDALLNTKENDR